MANSLSCLRLPVRIPIFRLLLGPQIWSSYVILIHRIYRAIARRLREENGGVHSRVYGKLYTPEAGIFLVELVPEDSEAGVLTLLFRFMDLYFESYHFNGIWYRLSDHKAELPPQELLPYTDIVTLRKISTSYANLGGYCKIGKSAFRKCYDTLSHTAELVTTRRGRAHLQSGPLSLPAIAIAEAVRFRALDRWIKGTLQGERDRAIPQDLSLYFTEWGDSSSAMYRKEVPSFCTLSMGQLRKRMGVLKRRNMKDEKQTKSINDKPAAYILGWHKEDRKRMLQASLSVANLDQSISYYKNCFGMKLLRQENAPEELGIRAIMGYGKEVKSFVLQLKQEERAEEQDKTSVIEDTKQPLGFGHIAIAHTDVHKFVHTIITNGGMITCYPDPLTEGSSVSASAEDPDGYRFELLQRGPTPERICQLMLYVTDIDRAIKFYEKALGMLLLTKKCVFKGQCYTTIARLGYADEGRVTVLELTCRNGVRDYNTENGYTQLTIGTNSVQRTREAVAFAIKSLGGQILEEPTLIPVVKVDMMSFVDPDGWKVVLVNKNDFLTELP